MNLVIIEPPELDANNIVTLQDSRAAHLANVLRVAPGSTVRIGLLEGPLGTGTVTAVSDGRVTLRCAWNADTPPGPRVDLLLALPRPKVMRRLWAQLAALGVGRIILTNAARVERNYFDTHVLDQSVYRPLLIEGLQQARDTRLPDVAVHRQFRPLIEDEVPVRYGDAVRLVADPSGSLEVTEALAGASGQRVLLAVGPEGGWNDFERGLFDRHGFRGVTMGARTLRVDTACIALLALVHHGLREP